MIPLKLNRTGRGRMYYSINVPRQLGDLIPPETRFIAELTDEGILFRPAGKAPPPEVPNWIKEAT